jgi:drug/metabolite transporter (DMT)-like permease
VNQRKSILAAGATTIIWGFSYISIKVLVTHISPNLMILYRFLIASVLLAALMLFQKQQRMVALKDLPRFLISSFVGYTLYFTLESNGIRLTNASIASIIIGTIPILSLLTDTLWMKKTLSTSKLVSVVLSFFGVFLVVGLGDGAPVSPAGVLLIFGAAACWILFNYLNLSLYKDYSSLTITSWQTFIALAASFFIVMVREGTFFVSLSGVQGLHLLFLGVVSSAVGFLCYIYALRHLGTVTTSLFVNFIPVTTMLTGRFFLQENLGPLQWVGGLLIVASLTFGTMEPKGNRGSLPVEAAESTD